jgi:DnaJ-class molecular chaperone
MGMNHLSPLTPVKIQMVQRCPNVISYKSMAMYVLQHAAWGRICASGCRLSLRGSACTASGAAPDSQRHRLKEHSSGRSDADGFRTMQKTLEGYVTMDVPCNSCPGVPEICKKNLCLKCRVQAVEDYVCVTVCIRKGGILIMRMNLTLSGEKRYRNGRGWGCPGPRMFFFGSDQDELA